MKEYQYLSTLIENVMPVFSRMAGFFCLLPLASGIDQFFIRLILMIAFTLIFHEEYSQEWNLVTIIFNFTYGFALSIPLLIIIGVAEMVGDLFDSLRGMSFAAFIDPSSGSQLTLSSIFTKWASVSLFISSGGLIVLLRPLGVFRLDQLSLGNLIAHILVSFTQSMLMFLIICVVFIIVEVICAVCSRIMRLSLYTEIFTVKTVVGYLLLISIHHAMPDNWLLKFIQMELISE